jgi:hypothetical protein
LGILNGCVGSGSTSTACCVEVLNVKEKTKKRIRGAAAVLFRAFLGDVSRLLSESCKHLMTGWRLDMKKKDRSKRSQGIKRTHAGSQNGACGRKHHEDGETRDNYDPGKETEVLEQMEVK